MEGAGVTIAAEIEFQRLRFQEPLRRHIVDHEPREIRLTRHRADAGEFRGGEPRKVVGVGMRIANTLQKRRAWGGRHATRSAQLPERGSGSAHQASRSWGDRLSASYPGSASIPNRLVREILLLGTSPPS